MLFAPVKCPFVCSQLKSRKEVLSMRKQVQKGRCTRLKLQKCPQVCALYDKLQLAYARQLDAEENVVSIEVNVQLNDNTGALNDLGLADTYTTGFLLTLADGTQAVREAVYRQHLSRPSVAALLESSKRYWASKGISDWGIIIDREEVTL